MNNKIYNYEQLQNMIIPLINKYNASDAVLFGSYAKNEATESSDIDLVVIGGKDFEPTDSSSPKLRSKLLVNLCKEITNLRFVDFYCHLCYSRGTAYAIREACRCL